MNYVHIKLVVAGDRMRDGGFVFVETGRLINVGHLAKHAYEEVFKHREVVSREMNIHVAELVGSKEPTPEAELAALSTPRLQVGDQIKSGWFLLAVVEAKHVQGKLPITAQTPPFISCGFLLSLLFVRLMLRRASLSLARGFKSFVG